MWPHVPRGDANPLTFALDLALGLERLKGRRHCRRCTRIRVCYVLVARAGAAIAATTPPLCADCAGIR